MGHAHGSPTEDIFAMLRSQDDQTIPRAELADRVERLRDRARELEAAGGIVLGPRLARATGREILDEALRAFSGYHTTPVLEPRGDLLLLVDTRLIFYYQNRLAAHGLAADLVAPRQERATPAPVTAQLTGKTARFALGSRAP
jgi:glycerol-3-phosphate O-acyltransferase